MIESKEASAFPRNFTIENGAAQQELGNSFTGYLASVEVGVLFAVLQIGSLVILNKRTRKKWTVEILRNLFRDIDTPRLDVFGLFRFLRMLCILFPAASLFILPVLLPLNFLRSRPSSTVKGLDKFSWLNIPGSEKSRLWVHLFLACAFTVLVCRLIDDEMRQIRCLRQRKLQNKRHATYVLVGMPSSSIRDLRESEIARIFGCETRLYIASDSGGLGINNKRLVKSLTMAESMSTRWSGIQGRLSKRRVESLERTLRSVEKLHQSCKDYEMSNLAVLEVVGKTHLNVVPKRLLWPLRVFSVDSSLTRVNWTSARMQHVQRALVNLIMGCLTCGVAVIVALPVTFSASLAQIRYIAQGVSWLPWMSRASPWAISYLEGALPQLILAGVVALVPSILQILLRWHSYVTFSQAELAFQRYYSLFLFLQAFLLVSITSSIWATLSTMLRQPSAVPAVLASNLPKAGNYFLSYLTLQGLSLFAEMVAQWRHLFRTIVFSKMENRTPRMVHSDNSQDLFYLPSMYPVVTILGIITISYVIIVPLVLVPSSFAFLILLIAFKPALEKFDKTKPDTEGELFCQALNFLFAGLYTMHLCLVGLFLSAKSTIDDHVCIAQAAVMIGVLISTACFHAYVVFREQNALLSLLPSRAVDLERRELVWTTEQPINTSNIEPAITSPPDIVGTCLIPKDTDFSHTSAKPVWSIGLAAQLDASKRKIFFKTRVSVWIPRTNTFSNLCIRNILREWLSNAQLPMCDKQGILLEEQGGNIYRIFPC